MTAPAPRIRSGGFFGLWLTFVCLPALLNGSVRFIDGGPEDTALLVRLGPDVSYYFSSGATPSPSQPDLPEDDPNRYAASLYEQSISNLQNLSANLASVGLSERDVVFLRVYLVPDTAGAIQWEDFWRAYSDFFGSPVNANRPPVSLMGIAALGRPGMRVEIEYVATHSASAYAGLPPGETDYHPYVRSNLRPGSRIASGKSLHPQASLLWVSGQVAAPLNPEAPSSQWRFDPDVYTQAVSTLEKLGQTLAAAGLDFSDVVFLRAFLAEGEDQTARLEAWNRAYGEFFAHLEAPSRTARTTVTMPRFDLEGMQIEIELVAAYPDPRGPFPGPEGGSNPRLRAYGSPDFPIASAMGVDRRATLYWSGTILPTVAGSLEAQARSALEQVQTLLAAEGLGLADLVHLRAYVVTEPGKTMDRLGWNAAYTQFFGTAEQPSRPARTTVPISGLPGEGLRIALDFVAADPRSGHQPSPPPASE